MQEILAAHLGFQKRIQETWDTQEFSSWCPAQILRQFQRKLLTKSEALQYEMPNTKGKHKKSSKITLLPKVKKIKNPFLPEKS